MVSNRKRVRYTIDMHFSSLEAFIHRLKTVRKHLTQDGSVSLDNHGLMLALFNAAEREVVEITPDQVPDIGGDTSTTAVDGGDIMSTCIPLKKTFLQNGGKVYFIYIHTYIHVHNI